tara:strand:+ start:1911 stop:2150 length:240 start_codon:yes stop_codon:yes gene_type:complete
MKKIILIFAIALVVFGCNKSGNKSLSPTVYCMFTNDYNTHVFRGCAEGKEAMQSKTIELRNQGYTEITNTEKTTCSECN